MEGSFALGLPLLVLIIVVVLALVFGRRGRFFMGSSRRLHHRHIVTRIVCGALGMGILVATGIGTWRDVSAMYGPAMEPVTEDTVRIPTLPAPQLSEMPKRTGRMDIEKCRLLAFLTVGDFSSGRWEPFAAREFEINWPADRGKTLTLNTVVEGTPIELSCSLDSLRLQPWGGAGSLRLVAHCSMSSRFRRWPRPSRAGTLAAGAALCTFQQMSVRRPVNSLSILDIAPRRTIGLATFFIPIADSDPLKEVSGEEFAEWCRTEIKPADWGDAAIHARWVSRVPLDFQPVKGFALMIHFGLLSLLLMVATALLAQIFKRRGLAFAGVLTLVILFVAALDYSVLDTHLEHMNDTDAPLYTRTIACWRAASSFFYSDTALREIEAVAENHRTPKMLRDQARQVAYQLQKKMRQR